MHDVEARIGLSGQDAAKPLFADKRNGGSWRGNSAADGWASACAIHCPGHSKLDDGRQSIAGFNPMTGRAHCSDVLAVEIRLRLTTVFACALEKWWDGGGDLSALRRATMIRDPTLLLCLTIDSKDDCAGGSRGVCQVLGTDKAALKARLLQYTICSTIIGHAQLCWRGST